MTKIKNIENTPLPCNFWMVCRGGSIRLEFYQNKFKTRKKAYQFCRKRKYIADHYIVNPDGTIEKITNNRASHETIEQAADSHCSS